MRGGMYMCMHRAADACTPCLVRARFSRVRELQHARLLRVQLAAMRDFITTCRRHAAHIALLEPRTYFMQGPEVWTLNDLVQVRRASGAPPAPAV